MSTSFAHLRLFADAEGNSHHEQDLTLWVSSDNYICRRVASLKNVTAVALLFLLGLNEKVPQRRYSLGCQSIVSGVRGSDPWLSRYATA